MTFYGLSDKGMTRKINQDDFLICSKNHDKRVYIALCDGMGGVTGGEIASAIAIETFRKKVDSLGDKTLKHSQYADFLYEIVKDANENIYSSALHNPNLMGMGTTFVAAICDDNKVTVANVGDSRAYLIDSEGIKQITKDHSLVNELLEHGEISRREATIHPKKNVITRALGVEKKVECDIFDKNIKNGQYLLICSDGLTNEISDPEIHFEVCNGDTIESACKSLIGIANTRGGHDNITVIIGAF